jgi:hypothetical protein
MSNSFATIQLHISTIANEGKSFMFEQSASFLVSLALSLSFHFSTVLRVHLARYTRSPVVFPTYIQVSPFLSPGASFLTAAFYPNQTRLSLRFLRHRSSQSNLDNHFTTYPLYMLPLRFIRQSRRVCIIFLNGLVAPTSLSTATPYHAALTLPLLLDVRRYPSKKTTVSLSAKCEEAFDLDLLPMVLFFTSTEVSPPAIIYMGQDKVVSKSSRPPPPPPLDRWNADGGIPPCQTRTSSATA